MSETERARVLIIDDDPELAKLVAEYLAAEKFEVETRVRAAKGVERVWAGGLAIVVLDVMMPDLSGFEALRRIRMHSDVPVIMLTARGEAVDRIVGLELGADDYLPKPFNPRELIARIQAVLRRARPAPRGPRDRLTIGEMCLDPAARRVTRGGVPVELTTTEFDLLEALLRRAGEVVERDELYRAVIGRRQFPDDRGIDMHVSNLRRKLGAGVDGRERIKCVRGLGYQYLVAE